MLFLGLKFQISDVRVPTLQLFHYDYPRGYQLLAIAFLIPTSVVNVASNSACEQPVYRLMTTVLNGRLLR